MAYGNNSYMQLPGYRMQQPSWNQQPSAAPALVRPVTSIEEVRASPIEFDGSVFFFTDLANKCIYTKQIGMDGTAIIKLYEQREIRPTGNPQGDYVTKAEFEEAMKTVYETLSSQQAAIKPAAAVPNF